MSTNPVWVVEISGFHKESAKRVKWVGGRTMDLIREPLLPRGAKEKETNRKEEGEGEGEGEGEDRRRETEREKVVA